MYARPAEIGSYGGTMVSLSVCHEHIEKNDRINQYPYDEKKDNLKVEAQEGLPAVSNTNKDSEDNASLELSSVSPKSSLCSLMQSEAALPMRPSSFLQSRYRIVEISPSLRSRDDVYVAKLLYHRTLFQNKASLVSRRFLELM